MTHNSSYFINKQNHILSNEYKIPTDKAEIYRVDNFLTNKECEQLIYLIDSTIRPSLISTQDTEVEN